MKRPILTFYNRTAHVELARKQFMQSTERRQRTITTSSETGMPLVSDHIYWAMELLRFLPSGKLKMDFLYAGTVIIIWDTNQYEMHALDCMNCSGSRVLLVLNTHKY